MYIFRRWNRVFSSLTISLYCHRINDVSPLYGMYANVGGVWLLGVAPGGWRATKLIVHPIATIMTKKCGRPSACPSVGPDIPQLLSALHSLVN